MGAVHLKDYVQYVKRLNPTWGKKFGYVKKDRVGFFGSFTVDEAKLCLTTEDFGWKLGEDAHLAPSPPYVRLCYGEHHGEQESIRLFTGLSEVHLLKDLDVREVHYMLQGLGYVSYNTPTFEEDRWWGEGIDVYPQRVSAGLAGGKGPMFYSWFYRLPPWVPGLARARPATRQALFSVPLSLSLEFIKSVCVCVALGVKKNATPGSRARTATPSTDPWRSSARSRKSTRTWNWRNNPRTTWWSSRRRRSSSARTGSRWRRTQRTDPTMRRSRATLHSAQFPPAGELACGRPYFKRAPPWAIF